MIPSAPLGTDAGPDQTTAERRFRFELAAHPGSPARARRLARARLAGWSVCEDTCDTAALVISELVTNAIVHTASTVVVCELHDGEDLLRIAVHDEGCAPGEPHPSPQRPDEEHGRGLLLVDALCHAWGAQEEGTGLLVWADLPRGVAEPRDDLGWGVRPKRQSSDRSDEEEGPARQAHDAGGTGTASPATSPARSAHPGQSAPPAAPAPRVGRQSHRLDELGTGIRADHDSPKHHPVHPLHSCTPHPLAPDADHTAWRAHPGMRALGFPPLGRGRERGRG